MTTIIENPTYADLQVGDTIEYRSGVQTTVTEIENDGPHSPIKGAGVSYADSRSTTVAISGYASNKIDGIIRRP
ncbi:hypothetical protein [Nocardia brasiliensis]|uniref:hypothetical protein n=1 Tax=Nocardia brasiliensis TaxID=37326 RepID=UPI002454D9DB|nr:hypothetical protein [Nocardia brasiliensis]